MGILYNLLNIGGAAARKDVLDKRRSTWLKKVLTLEPGAAYPNKYCYLLLPEAWSSVPGE